MKKILLVLLAFVLMLFALGCVEEKAEQTTNNDVFTNEYFEGLKQMCLMGVAGPISGEEMQEVIDILQGATLSELGEGVLAEVSESFLLIVTFEDGINRTVIISDTVVAKNEVGSTRYLVADGTTFMNRILSAFGVPTETG